MAAEEDAGRVLLLLLPLLLALLHVVGALKRQGRARGNAARPAQLRVVINEGGGGSSGPASRLVRPKTEPGLGPVKREHNDEAAFDDEAAMKWAREDWARTEMERQRRGLEEIAARCRGRDEGGVVVLDDSDNEVLPPAKPVHHGDPR